MFYFITNKQVNRPKKPRKGTVQHVFTLFLTIFCLNSYSSGSYYTMKNLPLKRPIKTYISKGEIYANSEVETVVLAKFNSGKVVEGQSLDFRTSGLHKKDCRFALKKLSKYENFKKYLDFVADSKYDDEKKRVFFLLSSKILPFDMILDFKLPRITKEGAYKFQFDKGFLNGLSGVIHVSNFKNRCLFYTEAFWQGPKTKIPNIIFEFFSTTLSKLAMKNLFRISSTY